MSFFKNSMAYSLISLLMLLSVNAYSADSQTELNQLRQQIQIQNASLNKRSGHLNELSKQTQNTDRSLSKIAARLANTNALINNVEQDLDKLIKEEKGLQRDKRRQQNILAAQIETSYLTGDNDYLKLLLNQQDSSEIERALVYYEHLNAARTSSITALNDTLSALAANQLKQEKTKKQLLVIKTAQQQEKQKLEKQKNLQKQANINITKIIRNEKHTLTELRLAEKKQREQITILRNKQNIQISLAGLKKYKGKLSWPIKGKILHSFNSVRFSDVRWRGLVISADDGAKVRAISAGKVIFADWLRGFGMVTIIDHGQGYMSLYGHNQTLLKVSGEKVAKGEVISLAGRSGGQLQSGVYFEIRHKGTALNPKLWLQR